MKIEHALGSARHRPVELSTDATNLAPPAAMAWRRLAFWAPIALATGLGVWLAIDTTAEVDSVLRWPLIALLSLNVLYLALTGVPALIGVVLHFAGRKLVTAGGASGLSRTAILMPVHKEDPRPVFAAIEAMAREVAELDLGVVDLFVLSDTQDPAMAAAEQAAFDALVARMPATPTLRYRRRPNNAGRKVGNLAEFCERWGDDYDYMLVLDADSLMGGSAIARLVGLMDANAKAGMIQTVPYPVGRETLFARLQQFSARMYTPLLVEGLTFWQQADGNYWGHNAIIRIAPFRAHCGLPVLPGREPWGGEILCHDVVEAGLMRGAGWDVWVLPEVLESYEAVPVNLVEYGSRERRWCQGNLQHSGVIGLGGFRPVGRFHLGYGIAHYAAGPLSALFLALASLDAVMGGGFAAAMLQGPGGIGLVLLGATLLYGGKIASLVAVLSDVAESRRFGGRLAVLGGAVLEQLAAFSISAMLMAFYTAYVVELVSGITVRWDTQSRDDRGVSWREAWARMRLPSWAGLAWLAMLPAMPAAVWPWTLPLALGLVAACPLTVWSSRVRLGALARRFGLLSTPEELLPPPIIRAYRRALMVDGVTAPESPAARPLLAAAKDAA